MNPRKRIKKVSLKDIADKVGVSTALVSYVLNNLEKEKRVGAEMAKRIREVAREMNYIPNQIARSLQTGSTKTLGLIVADIANPFFGSMARYIEDEAKTYGYTVIIGCSDEDCKKSKLLVETMINRQVDGFIIVPSEGGDDDVKYLVQNEFPVVLLDRFLPDIPTDYVMLENHLATSDAVHHLVGKGIEKIGMIAYSSTMIHMQERIGGYREAMEKHGLEMNILVREVNQMDAEREVEQVLQDLLYPEKMVDAIIFATNTLTIKGLYFLLRHSIQIPEQLAIIGFDGGEAFDFFYAPLTYIKQPIQEMARESVRILTEQINGTKNADHVRLMHQFIERRSTG